MTRAAQSRAAPPHRLAVAAAIVIAVPFGWLLGVAAAKLLVGDEFGVFPVLTIPPALIGSVWFALSSKLDAVFRLVTLTVGTGLLLAFL